MKLKEWGVFILLGLVWGSSFLWIKIAVEEIGPFMLVAFRLLFGAIGLLVIMRLQKQPFPRDPRLLLAFLFMAVFQTALLVSRDLGPASLRGNAWGQLAVLAASVSYAAAGTFARKYLRGQSALVQATLVVLFADILVWIALPFAERPLHFPTLPITWFALAWLGLLGACLAYLLYFFLIKTWGATRAAVVTYVFPVIGLFLGIIFLSETVDWRLIVGSILVVAGIAVLNLRFRPRPMPAAVGAD